MFKSNCLGLFSELTFLQLSFLINYYTCFLCFLLAYVVIGVRPEKSLHIAMGFPLALFDDVDGLLVAGGVDVHAHDDAAQLGEAQRHLAAHAVTGACDLQNILFLFRIYFG